MTAIVLRTTITVRVNVSQRRLIDQAARVSGENRSDFILEAACEKAKQVIDHTDLTLETTQFKHFLARIDAPLEQDSVLRTLLLRQAPWET
jgi:uncharacterized protein (DUF1778 family)